MANFKNYYFLAKNAGQTMTGYCVNSSNIRTGDSFSIDIPQANGTNVPVNVEEATIPDDAVGAIVRFSGTTYVDLNNSAEMDFKTNYENYAQWDVSDGNKKLGTVEA